MGLHDLYGHPNDLSIRCVSGCGIGNFDAELLGWTRGLGHSCTGLEVHRSYEHGLTTIPLGGKGPICSTLGIEGS